MKNLAFLFMAATCFSFLSLSGCDGGKSTVVEAPTETTEEEPAMEGMTDEDYDAAMDNEDGDE